MGDLEKSKETNAGVTPGKKESKRSPQEIAPNKGGSGGKIILVYKKRGRYDWGDEESWKGSLKGKLERESDRCPGERRSRVG